MTWLTTFHDELENVSREINALYRLAHVLSEAGNMKVGDELFLIGHSLDHSITAIEDAVGKKLKEDYSDVMNTTGKILEALVNR